MSSRGFDPDELDGQAQDHADGEVEAARAEWDEHSDKGTLKSWQDTVALGRCDCGSWPGDGRYFKGCPVHDPDAGGVEPEGDLDGMIQ